MAENSFVVGLTGNIATGKSTVLAWLAEKGAHVLDADKLGHRAMAPDGPAYLGVVNAFGNEIVSPDGTINRRALGAIVFGDADALARLEAIVHPAVFELGRTEIFTSDAPLVVIEAIKLLESGRLVSLCDEVWVVTASIETQLSRLRETRNMGEDEATARMRAQSAQDEKVAQADRVIQNNGSLDELHGQLEAIWAELNL